MVSDEQLKKYGFVKADGSPDREKVEVELHVEDFTDYPVPWLRYRLLFESTQQYIEEHYYWIMHNARFDFGFNHIDKITDLFAAAELVKLALYRAGMIDINSRQNISAVECKFKLPIERFENFEDVEENYRLAFLDIQDELRNLGYMTSLTCTSEFNASLIQGQSRYSKIFISLVHDRQLSNSAFVSLL